MAAAGISDDEDDIWNYKFGKTSKSKKTSSGSKSKDLNNIDMMEKGVASSMEVKQNIVCIDVDSDDDFPFTSIRPVNKEKSAAQWASMFTKTQDKDKKSVDIQEGKKGARKNKRKATSSPFPLKSKTNHQRKSINKECFKNIKHQFSPTKQFPNHIRLSISTSSEDEDMNQLLPHSFVNSNENGIPSAKNGDDGSSHCDISSSIYESKADNDNGLLYTTEQSQALSDAAHLEHTGDSPKPKVVDVIILDDERAVSEPDKVIQSIDKDMASSSGSDDMIMDSDTEFAGGFVRDDDRSNTSSHITKTESPQIHLAEKLNTSSRSSSSASNVVDNKATSVCDYLSTASSVPLSIAARKQVSIMSFFQAKAFVSTSKPKSTTEQNLDGILDSVAKRNGSLAKSLTFPPTKTSSLGTGQDFPTMSSSSKGPFQNKRAQRECPFYKRIPGTSFTVDAFRYGVIPECKAYFLTHFHYDHYGGLTKKFAQPIYCSKVTGNLVERRLGVDKRWIRRLPMWKPVVIEEVTLTLMEANHCPGAVIVLFETKNGKKILHTGDFRASSEMEEYPALKNIVVDELYLDTTYCNPSYAFPSQKTVINFAVSLVQKQLAVNPNTLIVCGAYTIGKERIFSAIAKAVDSKICVMSDKKKVLDCLEDEELNKRVTLDWSAGQVHVLKMNMLQQKNLYAHHARHTRYTSVLAFKPTGWTHSNKAISLDNLQPEWSKNGVTLYGVPYSEHSSYLEMKQFVQFVRAKKILPTVNNGNAASRRKMELIFEEWLREW